MVIPVTQDGIDPKMLGVAGAFGTSMLRIPVAEAPLEKLAPLQVRLKSVASSWDEVAAAARRKEALR